MYFAKFPNIYYPAVVNGVLQYNILKDITINVRFVKEFLTNITLYDYYDIVDGETPEIISEKLYGTPLFHWIVMLVNEKYDYLNDFPMTYTSLLAYTKDKYGVDNIYDTHHYENDAGYVVSSDYPLATPISNMDYEETINESKRRIKIIDRSIIETVASDFVKLMNQ